jgi:hypothetical protein
VSFSHVHEAVDQPILPVVVYERLAGDLRGMGPGIVLVGPFPDQVAAWVFSIIDLVLSKSVEQVRVPGVAVSALHLEVDYSVAIPRAELVVQGHVRDLHPSVISETADSRCHGRRIGEGLGGETQTLLILDPVRPLTPIDGRLDVLVCRRRGLKEERLLGIV